MMMDNNNAPLRLDDDVSLDSSHMSSMDVVVEEVDVEEVETSIGTDEENGGGDTGTTNPSSSSVLLLPENQPLLSSLSSPDDLQIIQACLKAYIRDELEAERAAMKRQSVRP